MARAGNWEGTAAVARVALTLPGCDGRIPVTLGNEGAAEHDACLWEETVVSKIVECVPNFSEGRDPEVVARIVKPMEEVAGVRVLGVESDADHNRTVVTLVGAPQAVEEAAFRGIAAAAQQIDMETHKGAHPRMGATDVVPFVPVRGVTMQECVEMARRLGERVGRELRIPVYLYEEAATRPERRNLADVRRGEYEGLREEIGGNPDRAPDFGPAEMGAAGATAIGARPFLIAFNVNLDTSDLSVAKAIARAVRHSSGGFRYVKALGVPAGGAVQVTMNMTDYRRTPLHRVFEAIRTEAARFGASVIGSEIVGLAPSEALVDAARWYLGLHDFADAQILENRLAEETEDWTPWSALDAVAAPTATPGGGSVAALAGALAAALVQMYAGLTLGKSAYADTADEMEQARQRAERLRADLARAARDDSQAYRQVMEAYRLPKATDAEKAHRAAAIQAALLAAAEVPMQVARLSVEVLEAALEVTRKGNVNCLCDGGVAGYMARAALRGALLNVAVNARDIKDADTADALRAEAAALRTKGEALADALDGLVTEGMNAS